MDCRIAFALRNDIYMPDVVIPLSKIPFDETEKAVPRFVGMPRSLNTRVRSLAMTAK